MTPEERAAKVVNEMYPDCSEGPIAAAIREAVEEALLDASGTLAGIAFATDLDIQEVLNKARGCYGRISLALGAARAAAPGT